MLAPTLTTDRLTLRPLEMRDWDAYFACLKSDRAQFIGGPYDYEAAWGAFTSEVGHWSLFDHGSLAIDVDGRTVGVVSLLNLPDWPQEELGWFLYDGAEGKGYATEAAATLRDWYYAHHASPVRLASYIDPKNAASKSVAARLGAVHVPGLPTAHDGDEFWLHPAPDHVGWADTVPAAMRASMKARMIA